jgi:chemotaxis protein methyltransferase CheR
VVKDIMDNEKKQPGDLYSTSMTMRHYKRLSEFIYNEVGIKLPPNKKIMVEARIRKRLKLLSISSFGEYCDYLFSPHGIETELIHMIDVITTNKTDFFREPVHFDYLTQSAVPELLNTSVQGVRRKINVWSAGCSTGEEPYTLSIVLSEFGEKHSGFNFGVLASDICTEVLQKAAKGIYDMEKIEGIPVILKHKYFMKNKDKNKKFVRVIPELRALINFRRVNLMDSTFGIEGPIDIIFCRNVIIYFDRPTQERLLNKFYKQLTSGGYLFMGHSETMHGLSVPLVQVAPTIYRKLE